jgi:hypothetical protein
MQLHTIGRRSLLPVLAIKERHTGDSDFAPMPQAHGRHSQSSQLVVNARGLSTEGRGDLGDHGGPALWVGQPEMNVLISKIKKRERGTDSQVKLSVGLIPEFMLTFKELLLVLSVGLGIRTPHRSVSPWER